MDELPEDRKAAISAIRKTIKSNLDPKFKESMQYGMIGYCVPHSVYPKGYHCDPKKPVPFVYIASQKNHIGIYLFCLYIDQAEMDRFVKAWKATGKKLDMGKSCLRVKKLDDVAMDVLGDMVAGTSADLYIKQYENKFVTPRQAEKKTTKKTAKKTTKKAK